MKKTGLLALVLMLIAALFLFTACASPCENHGDTDGDGLCELCGKEAEKKDAELTLIKDGEIKFQIVLSSELNNSIKKSIEAFKKLLSELDVEISIVDESETDKITDCEVLVGRVKNRGEEYDYQGKRLGENGTGVLLIKNKVIIAGGSTDAIIEAFEKFTEDILLIDDDTETLADVTLKASQCFEERQEYDVTSVTLAGNDMRDYILSFDKNNAYINAAAADLQTNLYKRAEKSFFD